MGIHKTVLQVVVLLLVAFFINLTCNHSIQLKNIWGIFMVEFIFMRFCLYNDHQFLMNDSCLSLRKMFIFGVGIMSSFFLENDMIIRSRHEKNFVFMMVINVLLFICTSYEKYQKKIELREYKEWQNARKIVSGMISNNELNIWIVSAKPANDKIS